MPSTQWWKEYYADERKSLGDQFLEALVLNAPLLELPRDGALIFPHTRLAISGSQTAAVARAVIESGRDTVLAIGVLHGVPHGVEMRGIHGPGAPVGQDVWRDEFSLDNFDALLDVAARILAKPKPMVIARYPFQTGLDPASVPGYDELKTLLADGAALAATADMIHHGAGYGTPIHAQLPLRETASRHSDTTIREMLNQLAWHDYAAFLPLSQAARSDFRDGGPIVAELLGNAPLKSALHDLVLVDYSDALGAPAPTWVAAALVSMTQA